MKTYKFRALLQQTGWVENAAVTVDNEGKIVGISTNDIPYDELVEGFALPGFQNAHSHAFQYAMAGLAEKHPYANKSDDFWSWREAMYQLALTMDPEDIEAVATMLYSEMVRHGYTEVAEFHYLHHDKDGRAYANVAEHGVRLMSAANTAGIKLTLVPMFYQRGGFGIDPQPRQKRFISSSLEEYLHLLESTQAASNAYSGVSVAYGIHSLRAVDPHVIKTAVSGISSDLPFHIHIAEQLKEIEDCKAFLGARPVEWLLESMPVGENYHLVHATHLTEAEVQGIAKSGAHVVLCPSTEGNLGDGIFPLKSFQQYGGKWSIGTDSHVGLNPLEELRILDYGQRLISHQRNTFVDQQEHDSGTYAIRQSLHSGRRAMGNQQIEYFEIGGYLDAVVYDPSAPLLSTTSLDNMLSTIVYSTDQTMVKGTLVNGRWIVQKNRHYASEQIGRVYSDTINKLKIR